MIASDPLSGPLGSEVFPPGRSTFKNRVCLPSNVNFHSDLILKFRWVIHPKDNSAENHAPKRITGSV